MESVFQPFITCNVQCMDTRKHTQNTLASTQTLLFVRCVCICFCVDIYENDIIFTSCIRFTCSYSELKQKKTTKKHNNICVLNAQYCSSCGYTHTKAHEQCDFYTIYVFCLFISILTSHSFCTT